MFGLILMTWKHVVCGRVLPQSGLPQPSTATHFPAAISLLRQITLSGHYHVTLQLIKKNSELLSNTPSSANIVEFVIKVCKTPSILM